MVLGYYYHFPRFQSTRVACLDYRDVDTLHAGSFVSDFLLLRSASQIVGTECIKK